MSTSSQSIWTALERWRWTAFFLAGPLLIVAMRREWLAEFFGPTVPKTALWMMWPLGFALALLGLVGFYSELVEKSPRLAKVGRAFGLIGGVGLLLGLGIVAVQQPAGPYPTNLGPIGLVFLLGFQAFIITAAVFGTASWRTGTPSRMVGMLLVALAVVQFAEQIFALVLVPVYGLSQGTIFLYQFGLYGIPMLIGMLAVGYLLRTDAAIRTTAGAPDRSA